MPPIYQPTKKTPKPFGKGVLFVTSDATGKTGGSKRFRLN
jgi:hypothetical protein